MCRIPSSALALASLFLVANTRAGVFADSVVQYDPGIGFAAGYTDPARALGEPSRVTPGPFGGPVDPFDPPYLSSQLVSLGTGGMLTVRFDTPIVNDPTHPFGLDFLIFGNSGFIITNAVDANYNYIGTLATDGSLFANNTGSTRVSVSRDDVTYYILNPALALVVDGLFPTDGSGDFQRPVNPGLSATAFAGQTLDSIRLLYGGSGGGAGFDLGWAQDADGQPVNLDGVSFVRVEVASGKSEIDGFAAVPEPSIWALLGIGALLSWFVRRGAR